MINQSNKPRTRPTRQQKYRDNQDLKGLIRFELQLPQEIKERFDALVEAVAEEYDEPYDKRQRISKARTQVFDELTQEIRHDFTQLTQAISHLKEEIKALSPTFFKSHANKQIPIPEAIQSLPNEPDQLKQLITKLYQGLQTSKLTAQKYKRSSEQFEALYEAENRYNEELQEKITYGKSIDNL